MIEKTGAVLNPGRVGSWRGVIDQVEYKSSALGPYVSGTRVWRCLHSHRSENTAIRCAEREAANRTNDAKEGDR